jgi:hypothetical protein
MKQYIAYYTNDGLDGCDESDWCLCETESEAVEAANSFAVMVEGLGHRTGWALVECPESWVNWQVSGDYIHVLAPDEEYFWPIPNWGEVGK